MTYVKKAAAPGCPPATILEEMSASCLGKCILLCSLYRAMGIPAADVRIVTGELDIPGAQVEHAWIDMEYQGTCLQQDASSLLGHFAFDQFVGDTYTSQFVRKEGYAFNDTGFAIVSQLNRFKGRSHPGKPQTGR